MAVNPGGPRGADYDDPESADAAPLAAPAAGSGADDGRLDLSPATDRHARRPTPGRTRTRALAGVAVLVVVVGGLGVVLFNGLNDAATFFYNVDEAVGRRDDLAADRFRMQGNVVPGSVSTTPEGVRFVIRFGGEQVGVDHVGDPPELFGPEIPVVLEGSFRGERFASDSILIRHDNTYDEQNPERIRDAEQDAQEQGADIGGTGTGGGAG